MRNDTEATILRLPGQMFQTVGTQINNVYTYKIINKTTVDLKNIEIKLISHKGEIQLIGDNQIIPKQGLLEGTMFIKINKSDLTSSSEKLKLGIYSDGVLVDETSIKFPGPIKVQ